MVGYLKVFCDSLTDTNEDILYVSWNSFRWWYVIFGSPCFHQRLKTSILHYRKRSFIFWNPSYNLGTANRLVSSPNSNWRICLPCFCFGMLSCWIRLFPLSNPLKFSHNRPIPYHTLSGNHITSIISNSNSIISPTCLRMFSKVASWELVSFVKKTMNVPPISGFAPTQSTFESVASTVSNIFSVLKSS